MSNETRHYELRHEQNYIAKLREQDGQCTEVVFFNGSEIARNSPRATWVERAEVNTSGAWRRVLRASTSKVS